LRVLFWSFVGFDKHTTSEHLLIAIIEKLCESGHYVHLLQKYTGGTLPSIPYKIQKYNITTNAINFRQVNKNNFVERYYSELEYIQRCKKYISSNYDAVFIQSNNVAGFAVNTIRKRMPKVLITLNVQDIFPYNLMIIEQLKKNSLVFKILAFIQRYGYKNTDQIITISEDMKDTLVEDGIKATKITVIYNWSYQDELFQETTNIETDKMFNKNFYNVVYAGNIGRMQNVDVIIEAANVLKNNKAIMFHIIGDGVYKKELEKKAEIYGLTNVMFWPMQVPDLAPVIYSAADINVIPLKKGIYRTALPSKTATCLACQKPIIFAIGENSKFGNKIKKEAFCEIIDSNDYKKLANVIQTIKNDNQKTINTTFYMENCLLSKNSKKYVEIITQKKE